MDKSLSLGITIGATLASSIGSAFKTLDKQILHTQKIAEELSFGKKLSEDLRAKYKEVKALGKAIEKTNRPSEALKQSFIKAKRELVDLKIEARRFGISLENSTASAKRLENVLGAIQAKQKSLMAAQARREYRDQIKGQILDTVALGVAIGAPIKAAIDFESAMADVKKVVDFPTPQAFQKMQKDILNLSTKLPIAATGLSDIVAAAGQAGIARDELLQFAQDAAKMSVAFDMSAKEAGDAMAGLRAIFHLNQKEVVSLGDAYNHLSNNMNATARDILNIASRTGSTARLFGLTGEQLGALGATFLDLKTPPEIASTGINALLLKLATADKQGAKFQKALREIGFSADEMKQMIKEDAQGALLKFLEAVKGSDDVMGTLSDLFGAEYSDDIAKLVGGLDKYKKALGLVSKQTKYAGSMQKEYEARANTTANNLQLLKNRMTRVAINLGYVFLPALNAVLKPIGVFFDTIGSLAARFPFLTKVLGGVVFGFVAAKVAVMGLGYAWSFVADGAGVVYRTLLSLRPSVLAVRLATLKTKVASEMAAIAEKRQAVVSGLLAAKNKILAISQKKVGLGAIWTALKIRALAVAQRAWAIGSAIVTTATSAISTAFRAMSAAIMSNPIGLIIGGIALAAVLVIAYWKPIKGFFVGLWGNVKSAFSSAWEFIKGMFEGLKSLFMNVTPAGWILQGLVKIRNFLSGFSLFESGKKILLTLVSGIKSVVMAPINAVKSVFMKIRNLLPFSDAKEGPLSNLTLSGSKIITTLGSGITKKKDFLGQNVKKALQGAIAGVGAVAMTATPVVGAKALGADTVKTSAIQSKVSVPASPLPQIKGLAEYITKGPKVPSLPNLKGLAEYTTKEPIVPTLPELKGLAEYKTKAPDIPHLPRLFGLAEYGPEKSPAPLEISTSKSKTYGETRPTSAPTINVYVTQNIQTGADKAEIKESAKISAEEVKRALERVLRNERRLSYS